MSLMNKMSQYSYSQISQEHHPSGSRITNMMHSAPSTIEVDGELALETYINNLELYTFSKMAEDEKYELLEKFDPLELFEAVQKLNRETAMIKLEIHFLTDFLENNDPKLLIGLQQKRDAAQTQQENVVKPYRDNYMASVAGSSIGGRGGRGSYTKSLMSMVTIGSQKKVQIEFKLNFRAKADMAEKTANEVEKRVLVIEKKAANEIKVLRGHLEELRFMNVETQETTKNFQLHFLQDERDIAFLNNATERQLDRKIRKFANSWIKTARALLATMRLKITALQEHCQQLRNELLTKADLSGILTAIDFEKLMIKRTELLNSLDEKNVHMAGLKGITGKASLAMAEEKQIMMNLDDESKLLNIKTIDVIKAIRKFESEANMVEMDNEKDAVTLKNLKAQLKQFNAPSVNQYMEKKDEVLALEKEEKMLRRKTYIMNMKLNNTQRKCKRRLGSYYIVNQMEE